ncbi:putative sugar transporter [Meira miltonrushii]|uniref:Putative sugar transporter n=1 Tax=Meira miltonrushii TaxID=1280837 RepID=A0A316V9V0_9BASI|nr:putative sugar transporter [Meira miltonrushii]PWN32953.1 putative sugar transporter [Meira miltonrushii]
MSYKATRISNGIFGYDVGLSGSTLLAFITACCATGFLLVGYDNGVFGGLVNTPSFQSTFNKPDDNTISNIVSLYEIGCFFGALSTFIIGDYLGRRGTIIIGSMWMIVGAIIQAAASDVGTMIAGRIICGVGMGIINATVPILQAETSPAISRGKLVAIDLTVLNIGIVLSYWIDYGFNYSSSVSAKAVAWRVPIALQCVFIVIIALIALIIPDTPRWLVKKGRIEDAAAVLERLLDEPKDSFQVQSQLTAIQSALEHEQHEAEKVSGWSRLIAPGGGMKDDSLRTRRRLLLACFIQAAQQLGGINGLIYYSSTLFQQSIGLDNKQSALLAGGLNMCLILGSTISFFLIDNVGRKKLLIPCIAGMSAVMAVQSGLVYKTQQPGADAVYGRAASAMLFIFELFFSIGFQATVWLIPSEVLPLSIRTKGSALSTASNWICNFAVVKFTPIAITNIRYKFYIIFAILNAAWLPIIAFFLPETARKSLEEMDEAFAVDGWHIDRMEGGARNKQAAVEMPNGQGQEGDSDMDQKI